MSAGEEVWGYSTEEYPDHFTGALPSREAAVAEALSENEHCRVVWVQRGYKLAKGYFLPDATDIIETAANQASDECGDPAEDYPDVSEHAKSELDAFLTAWAEKHIPEPSFWMGEGKPERVERPASPGRSEGGRGSHG